MLERTTWERQRHGGSTVRADDVDVTILCRVYDVSTIDVYSIGGRRGAACHVHSSRLALVAVQSVGILQLKSVTVFEIAIVLEANHNEAVRSCRLHVAAEKDGAQGETKGVERGGEFHVGDDAEYC